MKKIIAVSLILLLMLSAIPVFSVSAEEYTVVYDGTVSYRGSDLITTVVVADGVTAISDNAFEECSNLTTVIIPASVTKIGEKAFNNCNNKTPYNR